MRVLFAVFQTDNASNGGVKSVSKIIDCLGPKHACILTNRPDRQWDPMQSRYNCTLLKASPQSPPIAKLVQSLKSNLQTYRLIKRNKISIFHCNDPAPFWFTVFGALFAGIPILFNLRDTLEHIGSKRKFVYKLYFSIAQYSLFLSKEMLGFYKSNFEIKNSSFIYSIFDNSSSNTNTTAVRNRIICIGASCEKKQQLKLIEAAARHYKGTKPNFHITFAGDHRPNSDAYAKQCEEALDKHELRDAFNFAGHITNLSEIFTDFDLSLLASAKEGLPRSLVEPLFHGIPFVSFDVCSAQELVNMLGCGVVVKQGYYRGLFDQLDQLFSDSSKIIYLKKNATKAAEGPLNPSRTKHRYIAYYNNLHALAMPSVI